MSSRYSARMPPVRSYKDLIVWKKSLRLVLEVYKICRDLPKEEQYGIASQIKRASISIPSNIAEGFKRNSRKEYIQFCAIASASAAEVETQLIIITKLFPLLQTKQAEELSTEVQKILTVFIRKLSA